MQYKYIGCQVKPNEKDHYMQLAEAHNISLSNMIKSALAIYEIIIDQNDLQIKSTVFLNGISLDNLKKITD